MSLDVPLEDLRLINLDSIVETAKKILMVDKPMQVPSISSACKTQRSLFLFLRF